MVERLYRKHKHFLLKKAKTMEYSYAEDIVAELLLFLTEKGDVYIKERLMNDDGVTFSFRNLYRALWQRWFDKMYKGNAKRLKLQRVTYELDAEDIVHEGGVLPSYMTGKVSTALTEYDVVLEAVEVEPKPKYKKKRGVNPNRKRISDVMELYRSGIPANKIGTKLVVNVQTVYSIIKKYK